jgi:hypothetical protein
VFSQAIYIYGRRKRKATLHMKTDIPVMDASQEFPGAAKIKEAGGSKWLGGKWKEITAGLYKKRALFPRGSASVQNERGVLERRDQALANYEILKLGEWTKREDARQIVSELKEKWRERPCTFQDIFLLEDTVLALKSGESLKRAAWVIRNEYRKAVGDEELKIYEASRPPTVEADETKLRTDLLALQEQLHQAEASQRMLSGIRTQLTFLTVLISIAVVVGFEIWEGVEAAGKTRHPESDAAESVLLDVFVVGVIGGCFSTLLRVQTFQVSGVKKTFYRLASLRWNLLLIFRSLVLGGLGAVVFYVIMRTNIVPLDIFPKFSDIKPDKDALDMVFASALETPAMAAKLYLFCFLAGFSERLVPDALSRLTDLAKEEKK